MAFIRVTAALSLALMAALPVESRLSQPSGHQLMSDSVGVMANPEIDAWHESEKKRIEDECNDLMRKLDAEKRQKLQDIVDAARKQVELERQRLLDAQRTANDELKDLEEEKKKIEIEKPSLGPTKDAIAEQERKIAELERLIAEKKACIDELKKAQEDLLDAQKKLKEAQAMVAEAQAKASAQAEEVSKEEADIGPAQQDLDYANEELERVKIVHATAAARLKKARSDLAEHDAEGRYGSYSSMNLDHATPTYDSDAVSLKVERAQPQAAPAPTSIKSGAWQPAMAASTAAVLFASFLA